MIPLKETVDEAVHGLDYVRRIYVAQRTGAAVNMQEGRDLQLQEVRFTFDVYLGEPSQCMLRHMQ